MRPNINGEEAIMMKNNCYQYYFGKFSYLWKALYLPEVPKLVFNHLEMQATTTLIESQELKFAVFSYPTIEHGPSLYFHSLEHGMTIFQIKGAEIFIDCHEDSETGQTILSYIADEYVIQR